MHFEISHEFDVPIDALELALMSPELGPLMGKELDAFEQVEPLEHDVTDDAFHRVWKFQARAPLKILSGYDITREMMMWHESFTYDRNTHRAEFLVIPRPGIEPDARWRDHVHAGGTYRLEPLSDGRTRRTVSGDLDIRFKLIGRVVERIALGELKKAYAAEADALRALCSLA